MTQMGLRCEGGMVMLKDFPDVLTVPQVAEILGVCPKTVYQLIHSKAIGSCRIGRIIKIPKVCVADYLNGARYKVSHL